MMLPPESIISTKGPSGSWGSRNFDRRLSPFKINVLSQYFFGTIAFASRTEFRRCSNDLAEESKRPRKRTDDVVLLSKSFSQSIPDAEDSDDDISTITAGVPAICFSVTLRPRRSVPAKSITLASTFRLPRINASSSPAKDIYLPLACGSTGTSTCPLG